MKRLVWILLAMLLLLAGCSGDATNPTEAEITVPVTEPVSIYMANSSVEQQTSGAVTAYVPEKDTYIGLATMGSDVVLVSDLSKLTLINGENGQVKNSIKVGETISCEATDFTASDKGISFYRENGLELVFLNTSLQQEAKVEIPEGISGRPCVSHTNQEVYYCKDKEVRALHLQTGISRMVKSQVCQSIELVASHLDGTMLACKVVEEDGSETMLYLDSATGQTLDDANQLETLQTGTTHYLAVRQDGLIRQQIFGNRYGSPRYFELDTDVTAAFELDGAYDWAVEDGTLVFRFYDFKSGTLSSEVRLVGTGEPSAVTADGRYIWFLAKEGGKEILYRWDVSKSLTGNTHSYLQTLYTRDNPDTVGLEQCAQRAEEIEEKYIVNLHVGKEAIEVNGNYELVDEYHPQSLTTMMDQLEEVLSLFPNKFLKKSLASGKLHISLVRSIPGNKEMVQFYDNSDAYIVLAATENIQANFLHGVAYVIDSHVLGNSRDYDTWKKLNPKGFDYDYSYYVYKNHADSEYLVDETRAFADAYGMTFPHEDRCTLFVAAMTEGNESMFQTKTMQAKLKRMCQGIREAYNYERNGKTYQWEQYLNTSLAKSNG